MYLTIHPSDLYFKIYKVYHKNADYVKCKILFFYKSNDNICYWLNPQGRPRYFKIIRTVFDQYRRYGR